MAIQVKVTIEDRQVTLEGPEDFVRAEVQRLTNEVAKRPAGAKAPHFVDQSGTDGAEKLARTEREFVALKKPSGHPEIVAVLAYFLKRNGQEEFRPEDMRRAYARAGLRPPKVIGQAVRDSKNVHDYLETGSERGTFRLSPHGERTVEFDLPRQ